MEAPMEPDNIALKGGYFTTDRRLDRLPQFDARSRMFAAVGTVVAEDAPFQSNEWFVGAWLDQGTEGACVGFGCTHELIAMPVPIPGLVSQFARETVYWEAQKIDEWEGGSYPDATPFYEGTSVLAGIKVLERLGYIKEYRWAFGLDDVRRVVGNYGPVIIGVNWYAGMFEPDSEGFIHVSGYLAGGHCLLVVGVNEEEQYFTLHNSWGQGWGDEGTCKISFADMARVLSEQGEACVPVLRVDPNEPIPEPAEPEPTPEPEPEPEEPAPAPNFFRAGRSRVIHDRHKGIRISRSYNTLSEALADIPNSKLCRVCKPKEA